MIPDFFGSLTRCSFENPESRKFFKILFSPDGQYLAVVDRFSLFVIPVEDYRVDHVQELSLAEFGNPEGTSRNVLYVHEGGRRNGRTEEGRQTKKVDRREGGRAGRLGKKEKGQMNREKEEWEGEGTKPLGGRGEKEELIRSDNPLSRTTGLTFPPNSRKLFVSTTRCILELEMSGVRPLSDYCKESMRENIHLWKNANLAEILPEDMLREIFEGQDDAIQFK
jgi:hypothetical protein